MEGSIFFPRANSAHSGYCLDRGGDNRVSYLAIDWLGADNAYLYESI